MLGDKVTNKVDGKHDEKEINIEIKDSEIKIEALTSNYVKIISEYVQKEITILENDLKELQKSELAQSIQEKINILSSSNSSRKNIDEISINKNTPIPDLLKKFPNVLNSVGNFASKLSKNIIYDTVKFFGGKFKPWGATKLTNFINKLGPIIGVVGTILDIFFSAKEENDQKNFEQELRNSRIQIREKYREISKTIRHDYQEQIGNEMINFCNSELNEIDSQQKEIIMLQNTKNELMKEMEDKIEDLKKEISIMLEQ